MNKKIYTDKISGNLLYGDLTYRIRRAIFDVYNELGFGHKEQVYQKALAEEFIDARIPYTREEGLSVRYKNSVVGSYRPDFVVDEKVILELKAVEFMPKSYETQLIHYLKTTGYALGLLVNFGTPRLFIKRLVWTNPHPLKSAPNQCKSVINRRESGFIKFTKKSLVAIFMAWILTVSTGLIYLFNPFNKSVEAAWYNDNWAYRKTIPIATHTAAETNVYITFQMDTATLITNGQLQSSCQDIRVTDVGGNLLSYHVGRTNACNASNTTIDALVPTMPAGAQIYYVYYGNPSAVSLDAGAFSQSQCGNSCTTNPTLGSEVKGPGPVGYWKFDEGVDGTCSGGTNDSCNSGSGGNALDGANTFDTAPSAISNWQAEDQCISGKCLRFDDSNDEVNAGTNAILDDMGAMTIEAWINPMSAGSGTAGRIADKTTGLGPVGGWIFYMGTNNRLGFGVDYSGGTNTNLTRLTANNTITYNKWQHVAITWDGSSTSTNVKFYIDGTEASYFSSGSNGDLSRVSDASASLRVGNDSTGVRPFDGTIDDVKVYNFVRTAAQIQTDFASRGSVKGVSAQIGDPNRWKSLSDGLVGYWKMDDSASPSTDSSGNANSGTWTGNATVTSSGVSSGTVGKFGFGVTYDGTGDYVTISDSSSLSPTSQLTLAIWTKPNSSIATKALMVKNLSYRMVTDGSGNPLCQISTDGSTWQTAATSSTAIATGSYYHVACTYDGANTYVFVNGLQTGSQATTGSIADNANALNIGTDAGGTYGDYNGQTDEARVYSRALSSGEIAKLYNFAPGPQVYYTFEEGSGSSAFDRSGNGNTGSLNGSPLYLPGKYGLGLNFDGADDYINGGTATNIDNIMQGAGMTVEFWFFTRGIAGTTGSTTTYNFINKESSGNGWDISTHRTGARIQDANVDYTTTDMNITFQSGNTTYNNNVWNHMTIVFNAGSGVPAAYLNGAPMTTTNTTASGTPAADANGNLELGRANGNSTNMFVGIMDDVRIYNYPRTPKQVVEDMQGGHPAPGSNASPVGYWKMDQGTGTTARDSTGLGNGLTLNTASWTNAGKFDKAWLGTGGSVRMTRSDDSDFDFAAADDFTLSVWAKTTTSTAATEYLMTKDNLLSVTGYTLYFDTSGFLNFKVEDGTNTADTITTATSFYDTNWHHVAAVKQGKTRTDLYVDGLLRASDTSLTTTGTLENGIAFSVGIGCGSADCTTTTGPFNGTIDEVKVYRGALTADEVKLEYNRGAALVLGALSDTTSGNQIQSAAAEYCVPGDATSCAGPVGEYKLDNNSNDTSTKGYTIGTNQASFAPGKYGAGIYRISGNTVAVTDNSDFDVADDETFTIEIWFRSDGQNRSARRVIIGKKTNESAAAGYQISILTDGTLTAVVGNGTSPQQISLTTTSVVDDSIWHHTALTIDAAASGTSSLYLDGTLLDTDTTPTGTLANTDPLAFGFNDNNPAVFPFLGWLDHALLYKYVRSRAQIMWDMNKGAPIAHWKMDECQGTTINDSSGNSFSGTLTPGGAPISSAGDCTTSATTSWNGGSSGKINSSIKLDGTDDYVSVSDTANLRFDASTDDFSLFAWVKRVTTGTEYILSKEDADDDGWRLMFNSSNAVLCSEDATDVTSTSTITDTNWHFVGCTIDRDGNGQVYIDGRADGSTASMGTDAMVTTNNLLIGARSYAPITNYLNGQIDDAKIFNYALTAVQVRTLYTGGAARYAPLTGTP